MTTKIAVYLLPLEHENGTRVTIDRHGVDEDEVSGLFSLDYGILRV